MAGSRVALLVAQKDATWNQEEWFVPLAVALDGVGPAEAAWQPPGGGNTIWQTLNHCNYYNEQLLLRLTGQPMLPQAPANDATFSEPGNPDDAAGWQAALERAHRVNEGLRAALAALTEADLDAERPNGTLGQRLPLWVTHDAYHSGQIVLLRKMQGSWPNSRG
jgi:uncharacterized damage-inducible protein DinB